MKKVLVTLFALAGVAALAQHSAVVRNPTKASAGGRAVYRASLRTPTRDDSLAMANMLIDASECRCDLWYNKNNTGWQKKAGPFRSIWYSVGNGGQVEWFFDIASDTRTLDVKFEIRIAAMGAMPAQTIFTDPRRIVGN